MLEMYTDGACSGNPGRGGWAWILVSDGAVLKQDSGYDKATTNNRMELFAVISGLEHFSQMPQRGDALKIYTDSSYVQQGITVWIKNWKKNGWKTASKQPVKNQDLWQKLDALQSGFSIEWKWVKGHADNAFNNLCDTLAVEACKKA